MSKKIVIRPQSGWKPVNLREVLEYKDLVYFLVVRGIKAKYAQSVLGVGWAIIQPLMSALVYTIIFGRIAKVGSDGLPYLLFSFVALVPWTYFSGTLNEASSSLVQNANMISKVYFPRVVFPLSSALAKLLDFVIGFVVIIGLLIVYKVSPSINILYLPLMLFILLLFALGLGMVLSAMAIQFRDVKYAMTFVVQLLMYAAPVVYPLSKIPEQYVFYYSLNPMVGVIEGFRSALLGVHDMPWGIILRGALVATAVFLFGLFYFRRMERIFSDVA